MSEQGTIERGDISTEDAEKLAASFRPSWELDDASTAIGPAALSAEDMALLTGSPVADTAPTANAPGAAPAAPAPPPAPVVAAPPAPAPPAPAPPAPAPAAARAPTVDSPPNLGKTLPLAMASPAAGLVPPTSRSTPPPPSAAMRDPFGSQAPARAAVRSELVDDFDVPKKSGGSKAIIFVAIGVGALVGVVLGIRFVAGGSDEKPKTTTVEVQPGSTARDPQIPPPPEVTAKADPAAAKTDPPKTDTPKADTAKADPPKVDTAKADPPKTAPPPPPAKADPPKVAAHTPDPPKAPPKAAAAPPPPPPATTQKAPPKSTAGGIVRDNPF